MVAINKNQLRRSGSQQPAENLPQLAASGQETVPVPLKNEPRGTGTFVGSPDSASITIVSNTIVSLPTVTVAATTPNAARVGLTDGVFTLTRNGSTASALTVNYSLGGTAVNGNDYSTLGTSATIALGAASATVVVAPLPSLNYAGTESAVLTVSANSAYTVGSANNATVTIAGNSVPGSLNVTGSGATITWASVVGKIYCVAYKSSLSATTWTNLSGLITATGTTTSYADTTAGESTSRYYVVYVTD